MKRIPFVFTPYSDYQIRKIVGMFKERDFTLRNEDRIYHLSIDPTSRYRGDGYSPTFYYDYSHSCWVATVDGVTVRDLQNPCFELINELRGYTLFGAPKPGDVVIDIGCSNAFISCYLAKQVGPTGRVVALEPDPIAFGMAMDNIVLNSLSNVSLLPKGIHHTSGTQQMVIASTGSSYIGSQATEGTVPVEVLSLESLIEQARIDVSRLRLVKLDIEGGEVAIAHDLVQLVKRSPAVMIAAASYHKVNGRESCAILEDCVCQERQLCVRTLYPYHTTTFIAHRDNPVSKSLEAARGLVNHSV